jgi:hypothetical protein
MFPLFLKAHQGLLLHLYFRRKNRMLLLACSLYLIDPALKWQR